MPQHGPSATTDADVAIKGLSYTQLRAILNTNIAAVTVLNSSGHIIFANQAAELILGLNRSDITHLNYDAPEWHIQNMDGGEMPSEELPFHRVMETGLAVEDIRHAIVWPNGDKRFLSISAAPLPARVDDPQSDILVVAAIRDVTDEQLAKTTLAEQVLNTQTILDHIVDGIISIDGSGTLQSFNPAAESMFDYTADEVLGKNVRMLMPNPHRDAHDEYLRHYQTTGEARIIGIGREVEGQRRDGSLFPMELLLSETTQQGQPLYVAVVRDITERKRLEHMKSEFISTVSHELRTPLTSISGALGLVVGRGFDDMPAEIRQMISIAHNNSQRLAQLINDLLDIEKLSAGKLHFNMQVQLLMPQIEQALDNHRTYSIKQNVTLVLEKEAKMIEVRVDLQRLQQVLANLLSNAIKFSPERGTVRVRVQPQQDLVRVEVADQGAGVPKEFHDHVFEKFAQADSSDKRQRGGTGLGLAISRDLIQSMGGSIGFESSTSRGSVFWIELPLIDNDPEKPDSEVSHSVFSEAARVLVVEDDVDIADTLAAFLIDNGYQVDIAHTGQQAMAALEATRFDALSIDLMLPDFSGIELIRRVRQQPQTAALPIVVVSARIEEGKLAINGDCSNIDWLAKPIDCRRLLESIESALSSSSKKPPRVLHVEDDIELHQVIRAMAGDRFEFELATSLQVARQCVATSRFDIIILDITLPDGSGWDLLPELRLQQPWGRVFILSGSDLSTEELKQVESALLKSRISPERLLDALNNRIYRQKV